jgi:hypothetical protein
MHGSGGATAMTGLILKRAATSRPSGKWSDDDYDVLADGAVIGRISLAPEAPENRQWLWTLAHGQHKDRGYEPTRERGRDGSVRQELAEGIGA